MRITIALLLVFLFVPFMLFAEEPVVTVLDFQINAVSESDMKSITSYLSASLYDTGRYTVIDTAQRDMILEELAFSNSGCTDESCQLEIGELLSAEYIVTGNIAYTGGRYILSSRMLQTETSATVNTAKGIYADLSGLIDDMPLFALELAGEMVERETPVRAASASEAPGSVDVAAWSTLGAGAVAAGVGGFLLYSAFDFKSATVDPAYAAYSSAGFDADSTEASEYYDPLWEDYETKYSEFNGKLLVSSILTGVGVASMITSAVLFLSDDSDESIGEAGPENLAFIFWPSPEAATLACRIRI